MTDDLNKNWAKTLQEERRSTLLWKYMFLLMLIVIFVFIATFNISDRTFDFKSINENILSGVVASALLSIVYDLFTKKQQDLQTALDQNNLINNLSRKTFVARGLEEISLEDLKTLTPTLIADDRFLQCLSEVAAEKGSFATSMLNAYFKPLWRTSGTEFYAWENKLIRDNNDSSAYMWRSRQRFHLKSKKDIFRVALTDRATLGAKLLSSNTKFDSVLVLNSITNLVSPSYPDNTVSVRVDYQREGRRVSERLTPLPCLIETLAISEILKDDEAKHVVVFDFGKILPEMMGGLADFQFVTKLSFEEPYFFVQADELCFVSEIVIDYSDIRSCFKSIWVASFIGNSGTVIEHDEVTHRVVAQVDGALMPGQGIALVWAKEARQERHE